jgi:O-antigen/teichoic acid export membrane protein
MLGRHPSSAGLHAGVAGTEAGATLSTLLHRYRYLVSAVDQIGLSVFNFILNIALLRFLTTTEYGVMSLWISVSLFTVGLQNATVNTPLSVYAPHAREKGAGRLMEGGLATVNLAVVGALVAATAGIVSFGGGDWAPRGPGAALAIPIFVGSNLFREYFRSIAFARRDMPMLALIDGPYLAVTTVCILFMLTWGQRHASLAVAFVALSVGCVVGCFGGHLRLRDLRLFPAGWLTSYRSIAGEVAWSLLGVLANHAQARSYVYLATSLAGLKALAAISAVGMLFRPVGLLMTAWERSARPDLASMIAARQAGRFALALARGLAAAAVGSVAWTLALLIIWQVIERRVLGGKYPDAGGLILPWAVASGVMLGRYVIGVGLQAAREFKFLAYAQIIGGIVSTVAVAAMIEWRGYTWTMWGMTAGEAACFLLSTVRLHSVCRAAGAVPNKGDS